MPGILQHITRSGSVLPVVGAGVVQKDSRAGNLADKSAGSIDQGGPSSKSAWGSMPKRVTDPISEVGAAMWASSASFSSLAASGKSDSKATASSWSQGSRPSAFQKILAGVSARFRQGASEDAPASGHPEEGLPRIAPGVSTDADSDEFVEMELTLKGRYVVLMSEDNLLGSGHAGSVYRGLDITSNTPVAVKLFKERHEMEFALEVSRLKELHSEDSFTRPADPRMWCSALQSAKRSDTFITMLDYSTCQDGSMGRDPGTGTHFLVMELGECDLRRFLEPYSEGQEPPAQVIEKISKDVLLAVAGLHSLGLGHQDVKPRNFVLAKGRWKLIDFEGTRKLDLVMQPWGGTSTVLYSPPEWCFSRLHQEPISVTARHDVWGVGLTILELVTLQVLFKHVGPSTTKRLGWIGTLKRLPHLGVRPPFGAFVSRVCAELLPIDPAECKTAAEVLQSDIFMDEAFSQGPA